MTHDSPLLNDSNKSRLRNTRRCAGTLHYLLCSHVYNTYARWPPEASYYVYDEAFLRCVHCIIPHVIPSSFVGRGWHAQHRVSQGQGGAAPADQWRADAHATYRATGRGGTARDDTRPPPRFLAI